MILSVIAAVAQNDVIGKDNQLPWHLPADTAYFRQLTHAAPMLMGRKTAESPDMLLSEKRNLVISRQIRPTQQHPPMEWYADLPTALNMAQQEREVFICGGAEIYRQTMPMVDQLYITRVHYTFEGDAFFPAVEEEQWKLVSQLMHPADSDHAYSFSFLIYRRKAGTSLVSDNPDIHNG
jgi:dihydrofolate reductase